MFIRSEQSWFRRFAGAAAALAMAAVSTGTARPTAAQTYNAGYSYAPAAAPAQTYNPGYPYPSAAAPTQTYPGYDYYSAAYPNYPGYPSYYPYYPSWGWA